MVDPNRAKSIFLAVVEKPLAERVAFLDEAAGGDADLRARVEALLQAHEGPDSFLDKAGAQFATVDHNPSAPLAERVGTLIGPYKLLEQIGEGGMGVVYMADQQSPVRRRVALKIIKTGMDTRQVIARFEAERQALALMDHTNIARVLDAGATDSGRPYFVMELVRGIPITEYCDQNNLPVQERLELFIQVCHAVQHAHQKGIIHRDLKPSNVLVTLNDGRPVPKVIDFGVAKATNQQLTEKTLFTAFAQLVGTPLYMSPEQAEMSGLDIDTRSDIYSLGVLLYELLTGTTPFDQQRLRAAAYDEMRRIIREEEPPRPSTRISTTGEVRTAIATHRQVDSRRLSQLVQGDLDWIVMKALEKDRNRRYDTAINFAADVVRHLSDQPVEACPPSTIYRLRKFVRRNRAVATMVIAVFAILMGGIISSSFFAASASREAAAAKSSLAKAEFQQQRAAGVNTFLTEEVLGLADPNRSNRAGISLLEALDIAANKIDERFPDDPETRAVIREHLGDVFRHVDKADKAVEQLEIAVALRRMLVGDLDPSTLLSRRSLGSALFDAYRYREAKEMLESTLADQSKVLGEGHPDTIHTAIYLGVVLRTIGDKNALELAEKTFQQARQALGPLHSQTLEAQSQYAWILRWRGETEKALENAKPSALGMRTVIGEDNTRTMHANYNYAACLQDLHKYDEAAREFERLLGVQYRVLGPTNSASLTTANRLAGVHRLAGDQPAALAVLEDVYSRLKSIETVPSLARADGLIDIANMYSGLGRNDRAAEFQSVAYRIYAGALHAGNHQKINLEILNRFVVTLSTCPYAELRNFDWAIELATKACELTEYKDSNATAVLANVRAATGNFDAAAKEFDKSLELQPDNVEIQNRRALVRLRNGDLAGYRAACAAMSKQFAAATDEKTRYQFTWTCGLGPAAMEDLSAPLKQARDLVAQHPESAAYCDSLGVLLYRTGNYEEAAKQLSEAIAALGKDAQRDTSVIYSQFFLAMAKQQLGDKAYAKRLLAEAQAAMDAELKTSPLWDRRTMLELFRRDAESMIAAD